CTATPTYYYGSGPYSPFDYW
nr:immunoglobulin heavy chain junction region [Macaca mulatta]MOW95924.1 immunoglobulin heavy chain junction region [Macaca mulatta]MOW96113.1 immunoglobulin heavy chain junction region [Macaca mulatta]